jgi:hypothetical protein
MMRRAASLVLLLTVSLAACRKDKAGTALVAVQLTDAPAAYEEVNVEVTGVELHSDASGWVSVDVADSIYDLLLLQDSANAVLDTLSMPAARVSQVRLILGAQNTVKVAGQLYPLQLSSQDESGLKLNVHQDLASGQFYTLVIDFDASLSVVDEGNGSYRLKPVLTAQFL